MAKRKYITIYRIVVATIICIASLITYAGAGQPKPGEYKFYLSYNFVNKPSIKNRNVRAAYFIKAQNAIALLKERSKIINNTIHELNRALLNSEIRELEEIERLILELEQEAIELASFSDHNATYFEVEYGLNNLESVGGKMSYKTDIFADYRSKRQTSHMNGKDISLYYKYKFYQAGKITALIQPRIYSSMYNNKISNQYCDISLLLSYIREKKNYDVIYELSMTMRNYFGRNARNNIGYVVTTQEMIKTSQGFIISNFTEYEKAKFTNMLYRSTIYNQISVAKELHLGNLRVCGPTLQVGYFWKGSLVNRLYTLSGPVVSLWFTL